MSEFIGRDRKARRSYGFDEIALVPGDVTYNPDEVDIAFKLGNLNFEIPLDFCSFALNLHEWNTIIIHKEPS
jgi:IMP dehydrogenase/GMP reductase